MAEAGFPEWLSYEELGRISNADMIFMRNGVIVAQGKPRDIVTVELVREVFGLECVVIDDPVTGSPLVVPVGNPL